MFQSSTARYEDTNYTIHGLGDGRMTANQRLITPCKLSDGRVRTLVAVVVDHLPCGLLIGLDFMTRESLGFRPSADLHFEIIDNAKSHRPVVFDSHDNKTAQACVHLTKTEHQHGVVKGLGNKGFRKWAERWNKLPQKDREFFSLITNLKPVSSISLQDAATRLTKLIHKGDTNIKDVLSGSKEGGEERLKAPPCDFPELQERLDDLVNKYRKVFSTGTSDVGKSQGGLRAPHVIKLTSSDPVNVRNYRTPMKLRPVLQKLVQDLLDAGVIERCDKSDYNAPVLVIPKKSENGKTLHRLVIDYRALNKVLENVQYPIPRIQDLLASFLGCTVFSCMDIAHAFYTLAIDEESRKFTSFSCELGKFQFKFLPQGLKISPSVFMSQIERDLAGLKDNQTYVDDIGRGDKDTEKHFENLEKLLQRLLEKGYKIKLSKCCFFRKEMEFVGHRITPTGIKIATHHLKSAENLTEPTTLSDLKSLIGFSSFLRAHIPNYCDIVAPLQDLLNSNSHQKNTDFTKTKAWKPCHAAAFKQLKTELLHDNTLAYPDSGKPYTLYTDASKRAMSAVLMQECSKGNLKPIGYWSKLFKGSQRNWAALVKEARAVYEAVKHFSVFIKGCHTVLRCDHKPLERFLHTNTKNEMVNRWSLDIQEYDIDFKWVATNENLSDCLSRMTSGVYQPPDYTDDNRYDFPPWPSCNAPVDQSTQATSLATTEPPVQDIPRKNKPLATDEESARLMGIADKMVITDMTRMTIDQVKFLQSKDGYCKRILARKDSITEKNGTFHVIDGLLYKQINCTTDMSERRSSLALVIPRPLQLSVILNMHAELAHAKKDRLLNAMRLKVYWKHMYTQVTEFCKGCKICQFRTMKANQPKQLSIHPPTGPGQRIAMDLWSMDHRVALTAICLFSQYPFAVAIKDKSAESVAEAAQDILAHFRNPKEILTDRGTEFENHLFRKLCTERGINHVAGAPHSPQTNGILERFHGYLNAAVRTTLNLSHNSAWWPAVRSALEAYRKTPHTASAESPLFLFTAQEPSYSIDNWLPLLTNEVWQTDSNNPVNLNQLRTAYALARKNIILSRLKQNKQVPVKMLDPRAFRPGDRVYRANPKPNKVDLPWLTGYRVIDMPTNRTAKIEHTDSGNLSLVNIRHLRLVDPVGELIHNTSIDCFPGRSKLYFRSDDLPDLDWPAFKDNLPALTVEQQQKADEMVRDRAQDTQTQEPPKKKRRREPTAPCSETQRDDSQEADSQPRKRTRPRHLDDYQCFMSLPTGEIPL